MTGEEKNFVQHNILERDTFKDVIKEALHEWLDEKFSQFGKWSLHGILASALAGLAYLMLTMQGWHK